MPRLMRRQPSSRERPKKQQTFEGWYKALPADVQGLVDDHVDGLRSALNTERSERKSLEKRLKEIQKQADEGRRRQSQLQQLSDEMSAATARASFFEAAHTADVRTCAWPGWRPTMPASSTRKPEQWTSPNCAKWLELFAGKTLPPANAGAGARQTGVAKPGMNDFTRGHRPRLTQ